MRKHDVAPKVGSSPFNNVSVGQQVPSGGIAGRSVASAGGAQRPRGAVSFADGESIGGGSGGGSGGGGGTGPVHYEQALRGGGSARAAAPSLPPLRRAPAADAAAAPAPWGAGFGFGRSRAENLAVRREGGEGAQVRRKERTGSAPPSQHRGHHHPPGAPPRSNSMTTQLYKTGQQSQPRIGRMPPSAVEMVGGEMAGLGAVAGARRAGSGRAAGARAGAVGAGAGAAAGAGAGAAAGAVGAGAGAGAAVDLKQELVRMQSAQFAAAAAARQSCEAGADTRPHFSSS